MSGQLTVEFDEVGRLADRLLASLETHEYTTRVAVPGLALAIGRLLSDLPMDEEAEHAFVQWVVNQVGMYFAEGSVN